MKKTNYLGMDLDISLCTNLKEGENRINSEKGRIIILLKNGKITFQLEEKIISQSKVIEISDEDEIEKVTESLSDDEKMENINDSKLNTSTNIENISFGSTNISGIVGNEPLIINDEVMGELEPIYQMMKKKKKNL